MNKKVKVAQCWYSSEQYDEIKTIMEDGHLLPALYSHWLEGAEQREDQARSRGADVVRVPFDPAEFRRFCAHFSVPLNADTRAKFATLKSSQNTGQSH